jgi:hypothetical protein
LNLAANLDFAKMGKMLLIVLLGSGPGIYSGRTGDEKIGSICVGMVEGDRNSRAPLMAEA